MAARFPFVRTGNATIEIPAVANVLFLVNTGNAALTFSTADRFRNIFMFSLDPGETFCERVDPFHIIKVTATSSYRGWVASSGIHISSPEYLYR